MNSLGRSPEQQSLQRRRQEDEESAEQPCTSHPSSHRSWNEPGCGAGGPQATEDHENSDHPAADHHQHRQDPECHGEQAERDIRLGILVTAGPVYCWALLESIDRSVDDQERQALIEPA
jgi:hypothetical protein